MVATDQAIASRIGAAVLERGGNAIDAAVAVSFALGVTRPHSTGLGGGGFMIARLADGRVFVFDYRERAPLGASADMYDRAQSVHPGGPPPSRYSRLAVGTPGVLAGLFEAHRQLGSLHFGELITPAIRLAENGFAVDRHYVDATVQVREVYEKYPGLKQSCPYVYHVHLRDGNLRRVGDTLRQPRLGRLLRAIRRDGPAVFYQGRVAKSIAGDMKHNGGLLTARDLADYRVARRQPLRSTYRDCELITMPPPSSGGVCLIESLNILEHTDLGGLWRRDQAAAYHYMIEAMKHAFADRARWLADADFVSVPVGLLTSKPYAAELAAAIDPDGVQPIDTYGAVQIPDDDGTSHYSIVDAAGNCVVATETINTSFGSLAAIDDWGLILNNEMDDFSARASKPNYYGLIQSPRNAPEPLKRPLSSMTPVIVLRSGKPVLLLGASGGPRIISSVLDVMVNSIVLDMDPRAAMTAPRVHHQWVPDTVFFDQPISPALRAGLVRRGHNVSEQTRSGVVQAVYVGPEGLTGVSDPHKGGAPAGY